MHSISVWAVLDTLEDAFDTLVEGSFDASTHPELLAVLERLKRHRRRLPVVEHRWPHGLQGRPPPTRPCCG